MGGDQVYIEIVIFAMIAVFLVFRLKSVLGRKTGEERRRPDPFTAPVEREAVDLGSNPAAVERPAPPPLYQPGEHRPLAAWLDAIREADPSFDERTFLGGAKAAFGMVVEGFAKGDRETLKLLLSPDVYRGFAGEIDRRQRAGETLETRVERVREADIEEARLEGTTARVAVRFVSDQVNVVRDGSGAVIDGDENAVEEVRDVWTFARDTRSRDPNWALVETRPHEA